MGGKYENIAKASDVQFADPTGLNAQINNMLTNAYNQQAATLGPTGAYDPNAYMNQFLGQAEGLANMAQGATAPLGQMLSAIANREARLGGEAALAAMPGAANSGAGMAAFADAYASPFAQAAAQTQQAQLGLTGNLWNQAMGQNANAQQFAGQMAANYLQGLQGQGQHASGIVAPQYEYKKGFWDYVMDVGNLGANAFGLFNPKAPGLPTTQQPTAPGTGAWNQSNLYNPGYSTVNYVR